jgi:coenzyme F420 hydrogenase subunit beta
VADISCGDAWENRSHDGNLGMSLVVVRTPRGQRILRAAIAAKYVTLWPVTAANVLAAQGSLLRRRTEIWGRMVGLNLLGIPTPRFKGFSLLRSWLQLPLRRKATTILGTARRAVLRRLYRRRSVIPQFNKPVGGLATEACAAALIAESDRP